jgi:hypothetical protein
VDTTEVTNAESSFTKFTNKAKQAASGLTSKLSDMSDKFGELPGSLGRTASAFTGVGKSMMALVANPLGAILAALVGIFAGLRAALTKSEEGMDALARVTSIFGAILMGWQMVWNWWRVCLERLQPKGVNLPICKMN